MPHRAGIILGIYAKCEWCHEHRIEKQKWVFEITALPTDQQQNNHQMIMAFFCCCSHSWEMFSFFESRIQLFASITYYCANYCHSGHTTHAIYPVNTQDYIGRKNQWRNMLGSRSFIICKYTCVVYGSCNIYLYLYYIRSLYGKIYMRKK